MDEIRDTQKTDSISRFIDAHAVRTNPFGENRAGERAYRRSERIVAAVHLLTNHIDPNEPVSDAIRASGLALLSSLLELRSEMRSSRSELFGKVQAHIRHMISLVRVLTVSGYVSMQNATTMVEALDELGNFMTAAQRSALSESISVSRDDLLDMRAGKPSARPHSIKDIKDTYGATIPMDKSNRQEMSSMGAQTVGQITVRSQNILDTLQTGGSMGIKDICANLPEYSEKMIQRELAEMVANGKVLKSGLKRWSKYGVAQ